MLYNRSFLFVHSIHNSFISVQSLSRVWLFVIPRTAARQASLSITNSQSLLKLMPIESVRPSKHLILCIVKFSLFSSVQLLTHVNSLWPHALQHARLPYPSPTPGACSYSCPLSQWCHPTISSSVIPFSSCLQSSPASGSFPMSQFFTSGDQSIGVSASASVFPVDIQDWFLELTGFLC